VKTPILAHIGKTHTVILNNYDSDGMRKLEDLNIGKLRINGFGFDLDYPLKLKDIEIFYNSL